MTILGQAVDGIVEVQDEGTLLAFQPALNFVGAGVTVTLDAAAGRYLVTIPAGGVTDHGALTGLLDDDHPQYGALAQAETWAALQTFSAGLKLAAAQAIKDSGGADRLLLAASSPHLTLTGDLQIDGTVAIESVPSATIRLKLAGGYSSITSWTGISIAPVTLEGTGNNNLIKGVQGQARLSAASASSGHNLYGLEFIALGTAGAGTVTFAAIKALQVQASVLSAGAGTVLNVSGHYGLHVLAPSVSKIFGTVAIATYYGLKIEDTTSADITNKYLIEAGPATPNLRLEANAPAVSGDSKLLLAFYDGAAVGLRRIVMGAANSGGAGFRQVLVAN